MAISYGPDVASVPSVRYSVSAAVEKLGKTLHLQMPGLAADVVAWMNAIAPGGEAANYISGPLMYPIMQLPIWLARSIGGSLDPEFSSDVAYSTVNGYYNIRLMDNVQDGHGNVESRLLPAAIFFENEFWDVYQKHFSPQHRFWTYFEAFWGATNRSVKKEAVLRKMGVEDFKAIAANKYAAAKIPLAAAALYCQRVDSLPLWFRFCDEFARATQLLDDLFDWRDDSHAGRCTYLLSYAVRTKAQAEPLESFMLLKGFAWGMKQMREQMAVVRDVAMMLKCAELIRYLDDREARLAAKFAPIQQGIDNVQQLRLILVGGRSKENRIKIRRK